MKLFTGGYLSFYMPGRKNTAELHLDAPTPLREILQQLRIPLADVHLVAVNGEQADLVGAVIQDGDVVRIFSSVDGG